MDTPDLSELESMQFPVYRKDSPPDRALVLVLSNEKYENKANVLHYVGPGLDWMYDHTSFRQETGFSEFDELPPGLWIWEGRLRNEDMGVGGDYDVYLDGDYRKLTPEELEQFLDNISGEAPWDDRLWIENYDDLVSQG